MTIKLGQLVLVHQIPGSRVHYNNDGGIWLEDIPHDCTDPKQHWNSRVVGWSDYHGMPVIGTSAARNPCHADWVYSEDSLTVRNEEDWADKSAYRPGDIIHFIWHCENNLHYPDKTKLKAQIEIAHIEPGDWYVSFPVPDGSWRFKIVVNEKDFIQ